jgi:uncharacterized protein YabN with tetrapyrrole methylase and pyrophosphatase domain
VQLTPQARAAIELADEVLYVASDPLEMEWIERLNATTRSLHGYYGPDKDRARTYAEIVEEILARVRLGLNVCAAFYGHPGVFVNPGHEAIRRARREGFGARMLPGISAEDCLFADLGIDPGDLGCQSFEATTLLVYRCRIDTAATLVLWQIGFLGEVAAPAAPPCPRLDVLVEYLLAFYPPDHETIFYQASPYAIGEPIVQRVPLEDVPSLDEVPPSATMVLPRTAMPTLDLTMLDRLGMPRP